ncbi:MAG: heavy metal translocating P-type ATPase [Bacilli bacterium]|nr:heavy metal translocating P-type ATPase [Bacilli bacterium]
MKQAILNIGKMSCTSCAKTIEKEISKLKGVKIAQVNFASEQLFIEYDESIIAIKNIKNNIKKLGYDVLQDTKNEVEKYKEKESKILLIKLIISIFFTIPLFYIAMVPMINFIKLPYFLIDPMKEPLIYAMIQLLLVIPIILGGYKFYTVGFKLLIKRKPNMDTLIAIGTTSALIFSVYNTILISKGNYNLIESLYYETIGVIITLILLGKYMETFSKGKTSESIKKLISLSPKTAIVLKNNEEKEILVDDVVIGDIIIIKPGMKIPVDGVIIDGCSSLDESMLTGESMPVEKKEGNIVYAASININGTFKFKVTQIKSGTVISQIIKLVEEAQNSKAPIAKIADTVSGYFVPIVILIAIVASLFWLIITKDIEFALKIFICILVIACPCALGLATPTAIIVGTGRSAENGILIKNGEALELAHSIDTIIFDKTGTITEGKPSVTDIISFSDIDKNQLLLMSASVEKGSEHPLGQAIVKEANSKKLNLLKVKKFKSLTGYGIEADINNINILIGNKNLMKKNNLIYEMYEKTYEELSKDGKTPVFISFNNKIVGIIAIADVIKKDSKKAIEILHKMGIEVMMITGDNALTANAIAKKVNIDKVLSEVLPIEKANEIKKLQIKNKKVAMVGDGINDALALAQADIGIAIGAGTDIAIESANIILVQNELIKVPMVLNISKKTIKNIKQNLFWAFAYNIVGIPIAAGLLYIFKGPLLNPMFAALAMSLSSVSVLLNALRLKKVKIDS